MNELKNNRKKSSFQISESLVFGKVPPSATELEKAVLGAIMLEKSAYDQVSDLLSHEAFYLDSHQRIFRAMKTLADRNNPIDLLTVVQQLKSQEDLEMVGGPFYVAQLTNGVVSSASIVQHSRLVYEKFILREIIRVSGEIYAESFNDSTDAFSLLEKTEKMLLEIGGGRLKSSMMDMATVMKKTMQKIEYWRTLDGSFTGVTSGFKEIDRATRGWQPGDLIIIAARPSVGKTAFALNLAENAASNGVPVALFSLEMKVEQQGIRFLSAESGIGMQTLQLGKVSDLEMKEVYKTYITRLSNLPIHMDENSDLTMARLRAVARRLVNKNKIRLIMIDYLQLMRGEESKGSREQEISKISRGLKSLAMELDIPIIALSQLSRDIEKRKDSDPMLSDLRESGAIEQDADMVIFLYGESEEARKDDASLEGLRHVKIAKQRNGTLLKTDLDFDGSTQKFKDHQWVGNAPKDIPKGFIPVKSTIFNDHPF